MKMKQFAIILLVCTVLLGSGCENQNQQEDTVVNVQPTAETSNESTYESPEEIFKGMFPDAEIYDSIPCDLDENGEDDYIILYTLEKQFISSGLAVCLSNSNYSSIDLNGIFHSKATLSFENEVPIISLEIKDPKTEEIYIYSIEYSFDKNEKEANFKISTELKTE